MAASKLKTSKRAAEMIRGLNRKLRLAPNIICRLAIGRSLCEGPLVNTVMGDSNGIEFNRYTLTGQNDRLFKALLAQVAGRPLTDEEYFEEHLPAHLERGVELLARHTHGADTFADAFRRLVNLSA